MYFRYEIGIDGELYFLPQRNPFRPRSSPFESLEALINAYARRKDNSYVDIVIQTQDGEPPDLSAFAHVIQKLNKWNETISKFEKFQLVVCLKEDQTKKTSTDKALPDKKEAVPEQETEEGNPGNPGGKSG